jgi:N-acetylmuramoyl-L-alanine amidase
MARWVLDPGHGGTDPGCSAFGIQEKVWALESALYISKRLTEHGIQNSVTRTIDKTLDSVERTNIIKNSGATKGLSLHLNAASGKGSGFEFIRSLSSDGKFEELLKEEFLKTDMPFRRIFTRANDKGTDYYFIHRLTGNVRMTIVEFGFLDNPKDFALIDTLAERKVFYESVVKAVCKDEKVVYKPFTSTKPAVKPIVKPEPTKPVVSRGIYRVYANGKQVGAFKDPLECVKDLVQKGEKDIKLEKI